MSKVDDYILKHLSRPPKKTFDLTQPAFQVTGVALSETTEAHPEWDLFTDYDVLDPAQRRFATGYTLKNPGGGGGESTNLDLTLKIISNLPLRGAEGLELSGERVEWTTNAASGKEVATKTKVLVPIKGSVSGDGTSMRAVLTLREPPSPYDLYRLQTLPGQGNLNVPSGVNDWSTDDDTLAANATKTLQLKTLANGAL